VEPLLLDAAMGTALIDAGLGPAELPEAWVLARPEAVSAVHAAAAGAGARLVLTCTFNLAGPRLEAHGLHGQARVEEIARAAVRLARAAAPGARVAGAVGPTALVAPGDSHPPSEAELRGWYEGPFRALAAAGADLLWTESHWDLSEARAALAAARATGLPAAVTLAPSAAGERLSLPGGGDADEALVALAGAGAVAVGVNCLLPGAPLAALAARLAPRLTIPLVVKPSAGLPGALLEPGPFAAWVSGAARAGASWVGGCCGTGPAHLGALARALGQEARG
jgi:5-methyltetrahydrofolate--homocysteine methyltransferase